MGCTELAPTSETCNDDAPCRARTEAFLQPVAPGPWTCLDGVEDPAMLTDVDPASVGGVALFVTAVDFRTLMPIPQLGIAVCLSTDADCADPAPITPVGVDMAGFTFRLGLPFQPAARFSVLFKNDEYLATELYLTNELTHAYTNALAPNPAAEAEPSAPPQLSTVFSDPLQLATDDTMNKFFNDLGVQRVDDTGVLVFRLFDCMGQRVNGGYVELTESDEQASPDLARYRFLNQIPANPPSPTAPATTDSQGIAGFANVAIKSVTATAYNQDGIAYSEVTIRSRADQISIADMHPAFPYRRQPLMP